MFRHRLLIALSVFAAVAVLEGLAAIWAVNVAEQQVKRGRVASDIQRGFIELSANKQRLRTWVSQQLMGAGATPAVRQQLQSDLRATLEQLARLSEVGLALDDSARSRADQIQRRDALGLLARSFTELETAIDRVAPLTVGADARAAWNALSALFDSAEGRDLRALISDSIQREAAAVRRERAAADATLAWTRSLWLATAAALAAAALLAAAYFTRALRRPLGELAHGARALQHGDLQHRLPESGEDEFTTVARSMNRMARELFDHRTREANERLQLEALVQARTVELQKALDTLRAMDARRRQLFADISHELRTPTTAIRGEAEVTLRGATKPAEEYKAALARIVDTSRQLGVVIDDLLAMARGDIDALSLDRAITDLAQPLAEALEQANALGLQRGVTVQCEPLSAEPMLLIGDAQRLRQLFFVLLDNAVRYSNNGGRVCAWVQILPGLPRICEVRIADNGIGIAEADLPKIFERHWRSEAARLHRADGSGLGLAIGDALARAHGGRITLTSALGLGTTAALRLPLLPAEANMAA